MARLRILLAEDEPLIRFDMKEMLEEEGYEIVAEVGDGKTALRLAEDLKPDLAIVDIKMPEMDGLEVARQIAESKTAPVLVVTAYSQKDFMERAKEANVLAYLIKPFKREDLLAAVEIARARFQEFVLLDQEIVDLRTKLETRKLVDRAKGIIMDEYRLSEDKAFRTLQKLAMDKQQPLKDICEAVIAAKNTGRDLH